ncbi:MAG: glycosyltransferase family 2 protein [Clostridia bacterium]
MQKEKKCLAIVPAYNEEKSIEKVVKDVLKQGCDVLVINDCSKDNTSEIAKKAGAIVIDLVNNLGIGGGVQTGYKYAKENEYQFAFQIDGDGQHDPKYIKEMLETMDKEKANIVIGSRIIKDLGYKQTFMRKLGGNSFVTPITAIWYMVKVTLALIIQKLKERVKILEKSIEK